MKNLRTLKISTQRWFHMTKKASDVKKTKKSKTLQPEEYEELILDYVKEYPSGLTITDISKGLGISRITINKYILVLEAKEKVFSKSIGAYTLFFAVKRTFLPWRTIASYYQGLLSGFSEELQDNKEEAFKRIGFNMNRFLTFPVGSGFPKEIRKPENGSYRKLFEFYAESYNTMDYMIDTDTEIEVEINDEENQAKLIFKDIDLLDENRDFAYHFYIICGMIEKNLEILIKKKVKCKVERVYQNNVEISIKII
jgi:hypothetical protein